MTNATLSLQSNGNKTDFTSAEKKSSNFFGMGGNHLSLKQQASISNKIELNGEDFVLLPISGRNPNFNLRAPQVGNMRLAPGSIKVIAYKVEKHVENEVQSTFATSLFSALFPVGGILEMMKHFVEVSHKMSEGNSTSIKLTEVQNINPLMAINPNKSFIPVTPFTMNKSSPLELWQQKRQRSKDESEKKKKRTKGLGFF